MRDPVASDFSMYFLPFSSTRSCPQVLEVPNISPLYPQSMPNEGKGPRAVPLSFVPMSSEGRESRSDYRLFLSKLSDTLKTVKKIILHLRSFFSLLFQSFLESHKTESPKECFLM